MLLIARKFRLACYLNIALAYMRQNQYSVGIQACSAALDVDPTNCKALYRRAQVSDDWLRIVLVDLLT
jgi:Tfp pilus assembly protein PilF